jgi:hypothetical protein
MQERLIPGRREKTRYFRKNFGRKEEGIAYGIHRVCI